MEQPALPDCPEPPGSSVVKAGFYGSGRSRRQRYWCRPRGQDRHRFTPTLPRLVVEGHTCLDCERDVAPREGPPTVRQYDFAVRDVAQALRSVAAGTTYKAASVRIRHATGRRGRAPKGQLVGDWVEQFALKAVRDDPDDPNHTAATNLATHLSRCADSADAWGQMCRYVTAELGPPAHKWLFSAEPPRW